MPIPWVPKQRWMPIGQYRNIPLPIKPLIRRGLKVIRLK